MHERKKGGQRKDKKTKRMHEAVGMRHELTEARNEPTEKPDHDVVPYKPGSQRDDNIRNRGPKTGQ